MNNDASMLELLAVILQIIPVFSGCFGQMDLHRQERQRDSRLGLKHDVGDMLEFYEKYAFRCH